MTDDTTPTELDLVYDAWGVISNVSEGDWSNQTQEWQDAAVRWREKFHTALDARAGLDQHDTDGTTSREDVNG